MAHDPDVAERIRAALAGERGVTERAMFGGLAFLIDGRMGAAAAGRGGMLLRVDPGETDRLVRDGRADRFAMRGRELDGWLHIGTDGLSDRAFAEWLARGVAAARSQPPR